MIVKPHAWLCKRGRGLESDWHVLMYYQTSCSGFPQRIPKPNFILTLIKVDFWDGFDISHTHTDTQAKSHSYWMLQYIWCSTFRDWGGWRRADECERTGNFTLKGLGHLCCIMLQQHSSLVFIGETCSNTESIQFIQSLRRWRGGGWGDGGERKSISPSAATGLSPLSALLPLDFYWYHIYLRLWTSEQPREVMNPGGAEKKKTAREEDILGDRSETNVKCFFTVVHLSDLIRRTRWRKERKLGYLESWRRLFASR